MTIAVAIHHAKTLAAGARGALALYVGMGVALPFVLHAGEPVLALRSLVAVAAAPSIYQIGGSLGGVLYLIAIIAVLYFGAQFALWNALLADIREGPVSEIMYGLVAGLIFLLVTLAGAVVVGLALGAIMNLALAPLRLMGGGAATAALVIQQLILLGLNALYASRTALAGPTMAAQGSMNPLFGYAESWRRTAPVRGRLFLLFLAIGLVSSAAIFALFALHGAIILRNVIPGPAETAMGGAWLVWWIIVFAVQTLIAAGLFRALNEDNGAQIFA